MPILEVVERHCLQMNFPKNVDPEEKKNDIIKSENDLIKKITSISA